MSRHPDCSLADAVNAHLYPRILHRSAVALRLYQCLVHLTTLRSWHVRRALRRTLAELPRGATILDIGCGSGDHLIYAHRRRPDIRGVGIDRAADAVALCRSHARRTGTDGMTFLCADVDQQVELPEADLILCVTVLQYVRDDAALLRMLRYALKDEGMLLLYVPVRNARMLSIYERLVDESTNDYDAVQKRQRVYKPDQVVRLLQKAGFETASSYESYGWPGRLSFELHGLLLKGLTHRRFVAKAAAALTSIVALPVIGLLMVVDFATPTHRGNGLLVLGRPQRG